VPVDALIGEENKGFRYILDGLNAERILVAAEAIGDAHFFVRKATRYANARVVFERPIGANQGVQFPIERAADLMNRAAAALFDAGQPCGEEANVAKLLAS
jgi:acyl-CoA dehydrogenase